MIYLKDILDELEKLPNLDKLLNELKPEYNSEKITQHSRKFQTKNGMVYHVDATESLTTDKQKILDFKFKLMNNPKSPKRKDFESENQYQIALQKSQIGITGTGNAFEILSKVIGAIDETILEVKPLYITFTADEENRQSLYSKLIVLMVKYSKNKFVQLNTNPLTEKPINNDEFWLKIL